MCEFRIGQKVVCVNARGGLGYWDPDEAPTQGAIYTITNIIIDGLGLLHLHLAEIHRNEDSRRRFGQNVGYGPFRFRPLVTDDSRYDISVFLRICSDVSKGKSRVTVEGVRS